jgi:hypothetical protein
MSTTQHTGHYNLPTFGDNPNDRPSWRGDFTDAMTKIDNQMYANATNITTATAAANNAKTAADAAKKSADNAAGLAQANKTDIAELNDYFSKLGVTSPTTAQNLKDTINGKAENTALQALQGTVSGLSDNLEGKANANEVYSKAQTDTTFTKQGGYSGTAQQIVGLVNGKADSSNVYTRQQADDRFEPKTDNRNILVAIGDSYFEGFRTTTPATDSMVAVASNLLGTTLRNSAAGGSGFITTGQGGTFSQQIDAAATELGANVSNVKYVVIGGGRNDNASSLRTADVANTIDHAVSKFPDAEIWVFPMLWDNTWPTVAEMKKLNAIQEGCLGKNCHVVPTCITWGMFNGTWMTDIHPNTVGSRYYGQYIASAIMGGPDSARRDSVIADVSTTGTSGGRFYLQITGLQMLFYLRLNKTAWDRNAFATINGATKWGDWVPFIGTKDDATLVSVHFDGKYFTIWDVVGSGSGGPGWITVTGALPIFH